MLLHIVRAGFTLRQALAAKGQELPRMGTTLLGFLAFKLLKNAMEFQFTGKL